MADANHKIAAEHHEMSAITHSAPGAHDAMGEHKLG